MEKILDRFLRYVSVDTQSDENSETQPSSAKQLDLLRMLRDELESMGVEATLDEYGYVMGTIPSNIDRKVPVIGFIAHVDTSPDASGANVRPQIIKDYDGGDIELKGVPGLALKPSEFPELLAHKGETIITTDGTTLLGADDKAGVAEIMNAVQYIVEHPEFKHGEIKIGFTPDAEIGRGSRAHLPIFNSIKDIRVVFCRLPSSFEARFGVFQPHLQVTGLDGGGTGGCGVREPRKGRSKQHSTAQQHQQDAAQQ